MSEKQVPLPLTGIEVREAILFRIEESLARTCHLNETSAYSSFSAKITINLTLNDFGREVKDNHIVSASDGDPQGEAKTMEVEMNLAPEPPNVVRRDTGQDIPIRTLEEGKPVIKKVRYQARKGAIQPKAEK